MICNLLYIIYIFLLLECGNKILSGNLNSVRKYCIVMVLPTSNILCFNTVHYNPSS